MKKILLVSFSFIYYVACFGQSTVYTKYFKTNGGNNLELSYYYEKGDYYVTICDWYFDYANKSHFSTVTNRINSFKSDLRAILAKYKEWENTAKANRVESVEKAIPCIIGYTDMTCDAYLGNATKRVITPYFVVRNYRPICEIRIWQYYNYKLPNYNVWFLSSNDLSNLILAIDQGLQEYIYKIADKKRTEELFK